jgi:hypothetical protein
MAAMPEGDAYAVAWFDLAGAVPAAGDGDQSPVCAVLPGPIIGLLLLLLFLMARGEVGKPLNEAASSCCAIAACCCRQSG